MPYVCYFAERTPACLGQCERQHGPLKGFLLYLTRLAQSLNQYQYRPTLFRTKNISRQRVQRLKSIAWGLACQTKATSVTSHLLSCPFQRKMQLSSASKLLPRLWATSAHDLAQQSPHTAPKDGIRFCSFNVLADGLAQNGMNMHGDRPNKSKATMRNKIHLPIPFSFSFTHIHIR